MIISLCKHFIFYLSILVFWVKFLTISIANHSLFSVVFNIIFFIKVSWHSQLFKLHLIFLHIVHVCIKVTFIRIAINIIFFLLIFRLFTI
mmetsp:Transcript_95465/g.131292  ORF Transcript_95465/g.131292 Transcript_95465/m.131292 type:complete len:90 (+) Transcript_95465:663-932(+)